MKVFENHQIERTVINRCLFALQKKPRAYSTNSCITMAQQQGKRSDNDRLKWKIQVQNMSKPKRSPAFLANDALRKKNER